MKSPFPGMDPFIEGSPYWADFHGHLVEALYQQIADTIPERYFVRNDTRNYIQMADDEEKDEHPFYPDVAAHDSNPPRGRDRRSGGEGPVEVRAFIADEHRERFVEVYEVDVNEPRLVTVVEVLSPTNKRPGEGRDLYLRKRQSLMLGYVNLIEIDLLRGGQRMPMLDPWPDSPYVLMVARRDTNHRCKVWRGHSDRPLPSLPVPLASPDPDLRIDLQPMVDAIGRRARYADLFDYSKPAAGLSPEEYALAAASLKPRRR
jgi:hypothetical protein